RAGFSRYDVLSEPREVHETSEFITLLGHAPSTLDARKNLSPSGKQSHGQGVVGSNASNTKLTPT
ncbi:MAG: hypothetical protein WCF56_03065, partial [Pseudolabrys sp.]